MYKTPSENLRTKRVTIDGLCPSYMKLLWIRTRSQTSMRPTDEIRGTERFTYSLLRTTTLTAVDVAQSTKWHFS